MNPRALSHCEAIKGCVIIPVYNHAATVAEVVRGARAHAHTVLVCDDGSTDGSGEQAKAAGAELLVHPVNRGKGAALRTLFEEASRRGFRYAICLDADGQHYPKDIPAIVTAVKQEPGAIVIGARDLIAAGAPPSSEFGRKFSNFWVWFEGGQRVDDSQSGFRAYPLPETLALMGRRSRYDFEVEVLLRASWAGLPLRSTKIDVLYPKDRITHFRAFHDNALVSLLNFVTCLRLLLPLPLAPLLHARARRPGLSGEELRRWSWLGGPGPIWRPLAALLALWLGGWGSVAAAVVGVGAAPALVALWLQTRAPAWAIVTGAFVFGLLEWGWRRRSLSRALRASPRQWDGRSRGGVAGQLFFITVLKVLGHWPAYAVLPFVTAWFVFAAPEARRASMEFLDRAIGPLTGFSALLRTYRHLLSFAQTNVDRLVLGLEGPGSFTRTSTGFEKIQAAAESKKGSILLTAHLGSYETASGMLGALLTVPFDIVAYEGDDAALRAAIAGNSQKFKPNVLSVGAGELGALDILRALRAGHMVALQGDRTVDERTVEVDFLGKPARFPVGPFMLAAISGAPVIPTFNVQTGARAYDLIAFDPQTYAFERGRDKQEQLASWVTAYVKKLEELVRQRPYQWFNFYDFWAKK